MPSTVSQQLPRDSMAKWAKPAGVIFLPEGATSSSGWFSWVKPQGAVASQPVLTESSDVHGSEDVADWIQVAAPFLDE